MIIPLVEEETPVEVDVGLAVHHMALDEIGSYNIFNRIKHKF